MAVDSGVAAWLKSEGNFVEATVAGAVAKWGALAVDSEIMSALALKADAQTEATAQATFIDGPKVKDVVTIPGKRGDLIFRVVTIVADRLGYEGAGAPVFVLGANEKPNGTTELTVLKRLP